MSNTNVPQPPESGLPSVHTIVSDQQTRPVRFHGSRRWLTLSTLFLIAASAAVQIALMIIDRPIPVSPIGSEPLLLEAVPMTVVLLVGLITVSAQSRLAARELRGWLRVGVAVFGAAASAALMLSGALFLLDLVAGVLPGIGIVLYPVGALIRFGTAGTAVVLGLHTWKFWNGTRVGRHNGSQAVTMIDRILAERGIVAVGYLTVAACLTRLTAQLVVGVDENPLAAGPAMLVFETGFLLAGVLLPLALVHRWGRIWPRWVPVLAGRRVPRRLLIVCGSVLGVTMVAYFGMMFGQMVFERLNGRNPFPPSDGLDLPEAFFWISVPAYLIWGLGLAVCTTSYTIHTRPAKDSASGELTRLK